MIEVDIDHRASTLADVLRYIEQCFRVTGSNVPILVGKQYLEQFGVGSPPRILFVPEADGGRIAEPFAAGSAASYVHSCEVYVRAKPGTDDINRFTELYKLADKVIGAIALACTGKVTWGTLKDDSPLKTDTLGVGTGFSFTYQRDVAHFDAATRIGLPFETTTEPVDASERVESISINPTVSIDED